MADGDDLLAKYGVSEDEGDALLAKYGEGAPALNQEVMSPLQSAKTGFLAGTTLDFDDQIAGAGAAMGDIYGRLTDDHEDSFSDVLSSANQSWNEGRDIQRKEKTQARADNPKSYGVGRGVGTLSTALVAPGGTVLKGAALGGISALGAADERKLRGTETADATLAGAGLGGLAGAHPLLALGVGGYGVGTALWNGDEADKAEALTSLLGGGLLGWRAKKLAEKKAAARGEFDKNVATAAEPHNQKAAEFERKLKGNLERQELAIPNKRQAIVDRLTSRQGRQEDSLAKAEEGVRLELPNKREPKSLSELRQRNADAQADNALSMQLRAENEAAKTQAAQERSSVAKENRQARDQYRDAKEAAKAKNAEIEQTEKSLVDQVHDKIKAAGGVKKTNAKVKKEVARQEAKRAKAVTDAEAEVAQHGDSVAAQKRKAHQTIEQRAQAYEKIASRENLPEDVQKTIALNREQFVESTPETIRDLTPEGITATNAKKTARLDAALEEARALKEKGVNEADIRKWLEDKYAEEQAAKTLTPEEFAKVLEGTGVIRGEDGSLRVASPAKRVAMPSRPVLKEAPALNSPAKDVKGLVKQQQLSREAGRIDQGQVPRKFLTPKQQQKRMATALAEYKTAQAGAEKDPWLGSKLRGRDRAQGKLDTTKGRLADDKGLTSEAERLTAAARSRMRENADTLQGNIDLRKKKASPEYIVEQGEAKLGKNPAGVKGALKLVSGGKMGAATALASMFKDNPALRTPEGQAALYNRVLQKIGDKPEQYGNRAKGLASILAGKSVSTGLAIIMKLAEKDPELARAVVEAK